MFFQYKAIIGKKQQFWGEEKVSAGALAANAPKPSTGGRTGYFLGGGW